MPPKKESPKVSPVDIEVRPVRLGLTPDIHRLLRMIAADDEVSMSEWVRTLVENSVREEAKRRGIK